MREVIEEILGKEKDAQRAVEAAKTRAAEIKARADAEAAGILSAAREEAQRILRNEAEKARGEVRAAHRLAVEAAENENALFLERHRPTLDGLVTDVVRLILTPEHAES